MQKFSFEIQGLPSTTNSSGRKHWAVKVKEVRLWHAKVMMELAKLRVGVYGDFQPLHKAKITFTRFSARECDFDGLVSSFKSVSDALVKGGVIVDDRPSVVGYPTYRWEYASRNEGKIKVEVEKVEVLE